MVNELDVRPAAEHTAINQHPKVTQSGVRAVSETQHAEELHEAARQVGGSITGEATTLGTLEGNVNPEQFDERPNREFSADDPNRYKGLANIVSKLRILRRGGLKNAA